MSLLLSGPYKNFEAGFFVFFVWATRYTRKWSWAGAFFQPHRLGKKSSKDVFWAGEVQIYGISWIYPHYHHDLNILPLGNITMISISFHQSVCHVTFTKVIVHHDLPLTLGEYDTMHDFIPLHRHLLHLRDSSVVWDLLLKRHLDSWRGGRPDPHLVHTALGLKLSWTLSGVLVG